MAIIDVHYHFHPFVDEWTAPERVKDGLRKRMRSVGIEPEAQLEFLLEKMDEHGVEKTGLMNPTGDKSHSNGVPNGPFAKLMNRHSDRFFGWAGLHILPKPDLGEAKRAIEEYGFTGFKFIPNVAVLLPPRFRVDGRGLRILREGGRSHHLAHGPRGRHSDLAGYFQRYQVSQRSCLSLQGAESDGTYSEF